MTNIPFVAVRITNLGRTYPARNGESHSQGFQLSASYHAHPVSSIRVICQIEFAISSMLHGADNADHTVCCSGGGSLRQPLRKFASAASQEFQARSPKLVRDIILAQLNLHKQLSTKAVPQSSNSAGYDFCFGDRQHVCKTDF